MFRIFIWGAWLVTWGLFITKSGASGAETAMAYSTQSWVHHCAIYHWVDCRSTTQNETGDTSFGWWRDDAMMASAASFDDLPLCLGYMILYMPTLALVNSASFIK